MFSTTWKVEDIFPGWSQTKLEDWGPSNPRLIRMNAAILAFDLCEALGFGDNEEEVRRAEQYFMEMFLEKQRRTELLQGRAAAPKRGAADGGVAPGEAVQGAAAPGKAAQGAAAPEGAAHGGAAPRKAARGAAAPRGAAHGGAAPLRISDKHVWNIILIFTQEVKGHYFRQYATKRAK